MAGQRAGSQRLWLELGLEWRVHAFYRIHRLMPPVVLKIVQCNCTKDCSTRSCGCKKIGFKCSETSGCSDSCVNCISTCHDTNDSEVESEDEDNE